MWYASSSLRTISIGRPDGKRRSNTVGAVAVSGARSSAFSVTRRSLRGPSLPHGASSGTATVDSMSRPNAEYRNVGRTGVASTETGLTVITRRDREQAALEKAVAERSEVVLDPLDRLPERLGERGRRCVSRRRLLQHVEHARGRGVDAVVLAGVEVEHHRLVGELAGHDVLGKLEGRIEDVVVHDRTSVFDDRASSLAGPDCPSKGEPAERREDPDESGQLQQRPRRRAGHRRAGDEVAKEVERRRERLDVLGPADPRRQQ